MVVTKPSGEPPASIISIVPLRRKQQELPKCCKISTRPHHVNVPDLRKHHCKNLKSKALNCLYSSTFTLLKRIFQEQQNSVTCGVTVFVSSAGMLCHSTELKLSVTFKRGMSQPRNRSDMHGLDHVKWVKVIIHLQHRSIRLFTVNLCNNSVRVAKGHAALR
jgi:hypothetical protein